MRSDYYPPMSHRIRLRLGVQVVSPFPEEILKCVDSECSIETPGGTTTQFDGRGPFTLLSKGDRPPRGNQTNASVAYSSFLSLSELFPFVKMHIPDGEVWSVLDKQGKQMFIVDAK